MTIEAHFEAELEQSLHLQLIHERKLPLRSRLQFFQMDIQNDYTHFFTLLDGFETLMVRGGHNFLLVDLGPPKQQVLRGTIIDDMETSSCSYRPKS